MALNAALFPSLSVVKCLIISEKNIAHVCRCVLNSKQLDNVYKTQYYGYHSDRKEDTRSQYGTKSWVKGLTTVGLGLGLGLTLNVFSDNESRLWLRERLQHCVPAVLAAKPVDKDDDSDNPKNTSSRSRFNFIADIVEKCTAPVVYIEIVEKHRVDFLSKTKRSMSNGSGFIVKEDGLILTNAHVVVNAPHSVINVRLHNGQTYHGTVEEVDLRSDLATVRINCKGLPVMPLGKSSELRPGEFVVAIGSPLNLSNTVTAGVVSSINRHGDELGLRGKNMEYIQTDAAITFGNSGGPLLNLDGEAIGINSMKVTPGISFAIPIDYAKEFLEKAGKKTGKVEISKRRYMGITMLTLTPDIIQQLYATSQEVPPDVTHGVLCWKVVVNSPSHRGGLKPGDIITHVNGQAVSAASNIYQSLDKYDRLELIVVRGSIRLDLVVIPERY